MRNSNIRRSAKIGLVSLGCAKAMVDAERMITQICAEGYSLVSNYRNADLVIINTCGFINPAIDESLEAIGEAVAANGRVLVTGCLGMRPELIKKHFPNVIAITGPNALEETLLKIREYLPLSRQHKKSILPDIGLKLTPPHYAYLKIAEGCNHNCTFCIIPKLRGNLVSRSITEILLEAERLVAAGVKELLIIAQDTSAYGVDLKYNNALWQGQLLRTRLPELARALGEMGVWVRLHYIYPYPIVDELIPLMIDGYILPYLDIPFQHASPQLLKAMRRPANITDNLTRISAWRAACPELIVRSTFMVGFPGETEEDFKQLLDFLENAQLDRVGSFTYSAVDGAVANNFPNQISEEIKQARQESLMEVQADISAARLKRYLGKNLRVLVDEIDENGAIARGPGDSPEIDGVVYIESDQTIKVGEFYEVKIIDSDDHDLWATINKN